MKSIKEKIMFTLIIFTLLSIHAVALQQTAGELTSNITPGNSSVLKYGIRNEENSSITVKFNVTGNVSEYIEYPKELILESGKFTYIELKANIPKSYNGNNNLNGIIYALKEGTKNEQVQLNIRLGKKINLNIINKDSFDSQSINFEPINTDKTNIMGIICFTYDSLIYLVIGIITIIAITIVIVMTKNKKIK